MSDSPTSSSSDSTASTGGGTGTVAAWKRPDIVVAAPGGISSMTPATTMVSAGNTYTAVAQQDINVLAGGNSATSVQNGMVMFTVGKATDPGKPNQETGIKLHAASGNVHVEAQSDALKITADKAVEVASTSGMVRIAAPLHILLTAAGAALDIQPNGITLKGPGMIQFKASMKVLDGPASASQSLNLKSADIRGCIPGARQAAAVQAATVDVA